jgi:hypothetical protein
MFTQRERLAIVRTNSLEDGVAEQETAIEHAHTRLFGLYEATIDHHGDSHRVGL